MKGPLDIKNIAMIQCRALKGELVQLYVNFA